MLGQIYIAGESYAGQHIPYIARAMLERNKGAKSPWNLRGLLIGNGWISPVDQYEAYLAYAYDRGIVQRGSDMATQLELQFRICRKDLATGGPHVELNQCEKILQDMLQYTATTESDGRQMCYNMYDVRLRDEFPSCGMNWPPDLEFVTPYLRRPDVVEALHVSPNRNTGWTECSGAVGSAFRNPRSPPTITFLPEIIAQVPVVLFSGDQDLLCNHIGTEMLIDRMTWNGGKGFELSPGSKEMAPRRAWTVDGMEAGFWQEARNLTYIRFYNSSHMVPFDYARRTRDMLDRVIGIDVSSIGGEPANSRLDGEKGPPTTVGEHGSGSSNSGNGNGESDEDHAKAVQAAKWAAYRKSGEIVLVLVAVAAAAWGYYVWRERRRASRLGYQGLAGGEGGSPERRGGSQMRRSGGGASAGSALENFRNKRTGRSGRDLEAGDFDESELDDLHVATPTERDDRYSVGGGSDDEDRGMNGRGKENR